MKVHSFWSYFNPLDTSFRSYQFSNLKLWQKVLTVFLSIIATAGFVIGGFGVYRLCLHTFSVIDPEAVDAGGQFVNGGPRRVNEAVLRRMDTERNLTEHSTYGSMKHRSIDLEESKSNDDRPRYDPTKTICQTPRVKPSLHRRSSMTMPRNSVIFSTTNRIIQKKPQSALEIIDDLLDFYPDIFGDSVAQRVVRMVPTGKIASDDVFQNFEAIQKVFGRQRDQGKFNFVDFLLKLIELEATQDCIVTPKRYEAFWIPFGQKAIFFDLMVQNSVQDILTDCQKGTGPFLPASIVERLIAQFQLMLSYGKNQELLMTLAAVRTSSHDEKLHEYKRLDYIFVKNFLHTVACSCEKLKNADSIRPKLNSVVVQLRLKQEELEEEFQLKCKIDRYIKREGNFLDPALLCEAVLGKNKDNLLMFEKVSKLVEQNAQQIGSQVGQAKMKQLQKYFEKMKEQDKVPSQK